jgi:hypothetical protein
MAKAVVFGLVLIVGFSVGVGQDSAEPAEDFKEVKAGDKFHRNLLKAVRAARKSGKIKPAEALRIRAAMLSPAFRAKAEELAKIQMGSSDQADKIPLDAEVKSDWDSLADFLERMIPLVLQLIEAIVDIFAAAEFPGSPEVRYSLAA